MRGLLLRLSGLDESVERAVRVISSFDELVAHHGSIEALVRTAAALGDCPAGFARMGRGPIRYDQIGRRIGAGPIPDCDAQDVMVGETPIGRVWLEREGPSGPLDEIILERMVLSAGTIIERQSVRTGLTASDLPALDTILDPRAPASDVARAARSLHLDAQGQVRAIAVAAARPEEEAEALLHRLRPNAPAAWVLIGEVAVVLVGDIDRTAPLGSATRLVGVGGAQKLGHAQESLEAAMSALRFAHPDEPVVWFEDLGARSLLGSIPEGLVGTIDDVAVIDELARGPHDLSDLMVLSAFCREGTLRAAASVLHMHHSSVSHRLRHIEQRLGYCLATPDTRFRARLAIELWRLTHSRPRD